MDGKLRAHLDAALAANLEGQPWAVLYDRMIHQGTSYPATYELLPHIVDALREPSSSLIIDLGFVASALDSHTGPSIPAELVAPGDAAIARALPIAVERFIALRADPAPSYRGQPATRANTASYLALACLALARHRVGKLMWEFPAEPQPGRDFVHQLFCSATCPACEAELEWMHQGDGIVEYRLGDADQPPIVAPPVPTLRGEPGPWRAIAQLVPERVARAVLDAGVPRDAPDAAVVCVAAAMIAIHDQPDWSRRFSRLASDMRCPECDEVRPFVECLPSLGG